MSEEIKRRSFVATMSAGLVSTTVTNPSTFFINSGQKKLALHGGKPLFEARQIGVEWPYVDEQVIRSIVETTKSRIWSRVQSKNGSVAKFEKAFAGLIGADLCVATGSGTQALSTCVHAIGIGPGDEVITSPYSDFGTISSILTCRALPVLADLDPVSFQLDPTEVEKRITVNTRAIIPVHISGLPADMESIMKLAARHNLVVIEDACQAPFARYQGQPVGLIGDLGCFSFQASKSIACGEGGAIVGNDPTLMDKCYTVQNRGSARDGQNVTIGPKYRMNEFEGAILNGQLPGAKARFEIRDKNANFLNDSLEGFNGLVPQKQYSGTESGSYYRYALSYDKENFGGLERSVFLKAIAAEGVPFGSYIRNGFHREPWVDHILGLKEYQTMFTGQRLSEFKEEMQMPMCDRVTDETHVSLWGSGVLLGSAAEMQGIVDAIEKVYANRSKLNKN